MSAVGKYSLPNREKLTQPIPMQLSQKQKTFCEIFSWLLKSTLNFEYFQTKDALHSLFISEASASQKRG